MYSQMETKAAAWMLLGAGDTEDQELLQGQCRNSAGGSDFQIL